jgi:hypothetical protein
MIRTYTNDNGEEIVVQVTDDPNGVAHLARAFAHPESFPVIAKVIRVGQERAFQSRNGDINNLVIANKFAIAVTGSGPADAKLAYAQIMVDRLGKM